MIKLIQDFLTAARRLPAERILLFRRIREIHEAIATLLSQQKEVVDRIDQTGQRVSSLSARADDLAHQSAVSESRILSAVGSIAQEVNASLNLMHLQKSGQQELAQMMTGVQENLVTQKDQIISLSKLCASLKDMSAEHDERLLVLAKELNSTRTLLGDQQSTVGGIANEMSATLSIITGVQENLVTQRDQIISLSKMSASLKDMSAEHNDRLSALTKELTSTRALLGDQQSTVGGIANEMSATLSMISGQQAIMGSMANETNATLNSVLIQQSLQTSTQEILSRIQADAAQQRAQALELNLLVGRGTTAMIRRHTDTYLEKKAVLAPREPASIGDQINVLATLAPKNIKAWTAAFKAGIAEGERSVEGNLSHDGHLGAGYFRFFVNVHGRGRLLDFGCGPLQVPAYLADWPVDQLAAFDPQVPFAPHPFPFAQSLGESIPWDDASFETVVVATSLDHVYLLDKALAEIRRVLVPGGRLLLWTALLDQTPAYDPYAAKIKQPDEYHLFHPGRNWFPQLFEKDYDLVERMETVAQAEMLAYQLKV